MGHVGSSFYIGDVRVRVAETLYEQRLGVGLDGLSKIGGVAAVHKSSGDAIGYQSMLQQVIRTPIDIFGGYDMISRTRDI